MDSPHTPIMLKAGKKTQQWNYARARLKKAFEEAGITSCEIRLPGCLGRSFLGFAHTRKRRYVTDLYRVVLACQSCHQQLEYSPQMEEKLEAIINNRPSSVSL